MFCSFSSSSSFTFLLLLLFWLLLLLLLLLFLTSGYLIFAIVVSFCTQISTLAFQRQRLPGHLRLLSAFDLDFSRLCILLLFLSGHPFSFVVAFFLGHGLAATFLSRLTAGTCPHHSSGLDQHP
jgi:hypothetical protein